MAENTPSRGAEPADPLSELDLFERWRPFRSLGLDLPDVLTARAKNAGMVVPAIDIAEGENAFVITAEVPGASADDVSLELHDDVLTIRGEKRNERSGEEEQTRWSERVHGSFARSFSLPANADPDRVSARFDNGVLTVEVGKREESKPKVIRIQE